MAPPLEDLSGPEIIAVNTLDQKHPYIWMLELEVPTDPPTRYRLVNQPEDYVFGTDTSGLAVTYNAYNFQVGSLQRDTEGGQFNVTVTVSNVRREMQAAVELYDGLVDQPARVLLTNKALGSSNTALLDMRGRVITPTCTERAVVFEIGNPSLYAQKFPRRRISPTYCAHKYGDALCGYDTTLSGALQTCSKLKDDENGCTAHGDAEVAAGLTRQHPARFGGKPGVRRAGGLGV